MYANTLRSIMDINFIKAKKLAAGLMSLTIAVCALNSSDFRASASSASSVNGDVNGDSIVTISDALFLKRNILGTAQGFPTSNGAEKGDVSADSSIGVSDFGWEIEYVLAKTASFPLDSKQPEKTLTLADVPSNYTYALDWIWQNRIQNERSTERRNTLFDQIVAGNGTLNYVVRWQSYKTITLEQRRKLETVLEAALNDWCQYLVGYDGWKYEHIDVKIVGWAVIDRSSLLDLQSDEIVYDSNNTYYDSQYDTSNGYETIPDKLPNAPDELSRFYHFSNNIGYNYPGGLDKRFDMYLWATQGFPTIGGCGGDWGQRLSDTAYLNMIDSNSGIHVQVHELGHAFGITDFYGGEGASDGFPPGGFPGNGTSIMMAGSSASITDFDAWMLRYIWSKIKDEQGRFN